MLATPLSFSLSLTCTFTHTRTSRRLFSKREVLVSFRNLREQLRRKDSPLHCRKTTLTTTSTTTASAAEKSSRYAERTKRRCRKFSEIVFEVFFGPSTRPEELKNEA